MFKEKTIPLSIYVHIPWCIHKCPYCDFNSHELKKQDIKNDEKIYAAALIKQLENTNINYKKPISSIFFGGGTPSLFNPETFRKIITKIKNRFDLTKNCEITIEANPGTLDKEFFYGYKDVGVNRMSLGIQSFNQKHLKKLERIHNQQEAIESANLAVKLFDKVNIDLMFALPEQTKLELDDDIKMAMDINSSHISYYHLTIEPNTFFYKHPPKLPTHDESAELFDLVNKKLINNGFLHYETSAYAKKDSECKHNLNYWNFGDYIGIGAGAHSKITSNNSIRRYVSHKNPKHYISKVNNNNYIDNERLLSSNDRIFEFMMNALRINNGFKKKFFEERTNLPIKIIKKELSIAKNKKLLEEINGRIKPTLLGQQFLNELLQIFLKD
ncbi:MAG: YggW family oxidoreductase [Nitrosomonadales bacterium]|nr:YggW family oxidoreductase [Nitrosomonadales bacterium]